MITSTTDREEALDVDAETVETLVTDNTRFALDLHQALVDTESSKNHFVSPYSISIAMGMIWAGARKETATQTAEAMRFSMDQSHVHPVFNHIDRTIDERVAKAAELSDDGEYQLSFANSLWRHVDTDFRETYLNLLARHYSSDVRRVDFVSNPEAARSRINEKVEEQTNGEISDLLPKDLINKRTRFVLTNAVYFYGKWATPFEADDTRERTFTALDGASQSVPMMNQEKRFPYAEVDGHQLVELPYVGETTGMVVLLPANGEFERFEKELTATRLTELMRELDERRVDLTLPKFNVRSAFSLKETLGTLGMPVAFTPEADFGAIAPGNLFLFDVVHQSYVTVAEKGTEAAAATGVVGGMGGASAAPQMTADRPFLFLIRDRKTETILFLGRVVDAKAAQ